MNHGLSHIPEYRVWKTMRGRCKNPKDNQYKNYGARGITVCADWDSFQTFYTDLGPRPSKSHTIDRVDNNRGYCKENCRWATMAEQNRNKRTNRLLAWNGRVQSLTEWASEIGLDRDTLYSRLDRGWTIEAALSTPLRFVGPNSPFFVRKLANGSEKLKGSNE